MDLDENKILYSYNVDQLIANFLDTKKKRVKFKSFMIMNKALLGEKRNNAYPQFSDHYFTGDYPIKPDDNIKGLQVKQLSLLSGKSNN